MEKNNSQFKIIYISFSILVILRLLPLILPNFRFWGFNHYIFLPDIYSIIYIIAAIIMLSLPLLEGSLNGGNIIINKFNSVFYKSRYKLIYRLIFIIAFLILFISFTMPTHFLGDGYLCLENLAGDQTTIFKWSESGSITILSLIQNLLGEKTRETGLIAYQIISVLSGIITIWFYFGIAGILSTKLEKRFLAFFSILISGTILLFFGYVESYPILFPFISGFLYFCLKYMRMGHGLISATLLLIIAIYFHLQMAIFLPGLIFIFFCNPAGQNFYNKYKMYLYLLIIVFFIIGIAIVYKKYSSDLYFENMFLPLFIGKTVYLEYALISWPHFLDIINELLLVAPLFPILIYFLIGGRRNIKHDKLAIFFLMISISSLLFLAIIDPKLGMPRDWDLFSLTAIGITLLGIYAIPKAVLTKIHRYSISFLIYLIVSTLPFLLTNLNENQSVEYMKYIINLDKSKSLSSLVTLKSYYQNKNDQIAVDSLDAIYRNTFKTPAMLSQVGAAISNNNLKLANSLFNRVKPDKFSWNYHSTRGLLLHMSGEHYMAIKEFEMAIQLNPYKSSFYRYLGAVYEDLGDVEKAIYSYRKSYRLDSLDVILLDRLSNIFYQTNNLDSTYFYAKKLYSPPINNGAGIYYFIKICLKRRMIDKAKEYYQTYINLGKNDKYYNSRINELEQEIYKIN